MQVRILGRTAGASPSFDVVGINLGNGLAALATIAVTRTRTTPAASANATVLIAANLQRLGATIVNGGSTNLHVSDPVRGDVLVAPAAIYDVAEGYTDALSGFWEGSPTGTAVVTEFT